MKFGRKGPRFLLTRLAIITVASIAVLEMIVRMVGLAPSVSMDAGFFISHPILPFITAPNARFTGRSTSDEFDFEYLHNSRGFRDIEHQPKKPDGVFRILGLGDSMTYGAGAPFDATYLRQLEVALRASRPGGPQIEVVKAGIPRFFPEAERLLLEHEGALYSPDLVIVGFLPNDVMDQFMGLEAVAVDEGGFLKTIEARTLGPFGSFLFLHSHVGRTALRKYVDWRMERRYPTDWKQVYFEGGFYEPAWQAIESEYAKMNAVVRTLGASLVLVHIPISPVRENAIGVDDPTYPARRLSRWSENNNVLFVDTQPTIVMERDTQTLYWPKDGHCTPAGYEIVARILTKRLEESALIPRFR